MAKRGSTKELSVRHEDWIALMYDGKRSKSSGGADNDQGDVRASDYLIECKLTGGPGNPKSSALLRHMEKVTEEAWSEGKIPALALRFYNPESVLADSNGWVDLIVKRVVDDA